MYVHDWAPNIKKVSISLKFTYNFIFSDKKGKSKKHDSSDDDEAQQSGKAKFLGFIFQNFLQFDQ